MTTYVRAPEAARQLGVSTSTLYSYVSRGRVTRRLATDGRSSLFDLAELAELRSRNQRPQPPPPTIDVRIASAVTQLDETGLRYRGVPVGELVDQPFEDVCAHLWRVAAVDLRTRLSTADKPGTATRPIMRLVEMVAAMPRADDPVLAASQILAAIPGHLGSRASTRRSFADRLTRAWVSRPSPQLVEAVNTALVLLADHELATSTLAVRVAASVRADPTAAIVAGLATIDGNLHGSASHHVQRFLAECRHSGVETVLTQYRKERMRVPGFGHSVYRRQDPRFALLLDRVMALPDPDGRRATVAEVVSTAGQYVAQLPNIDLALGALNDVAGLPDDSPLFAVARIAGWTAHYDEEITERPLRYRGLSY
jgi:citrate synthase